MNEEVVFQHMESVRNRTISSLETTPDYALDTVPKGFNNSLRWNFGHILVVQEKLVYGFTGEDKQLPEQYVSFFSPRTSPSQWESTPPRAEEIQSYLQAQTSQIKQTFANRLHEKRDQPMQIGSFHLATLEEAMTFSLYHESIHQGTIIGLKRAQEFEQL
ncbi:DinB family protein [Thalassobacillus sp. CUG 92003]|uniref:DinB family protein n=1 Tax=Thalassobacillus sp. CUG 92003 TaxID=2736641 RepID=UPI0015E6719F|nr:DinB family protein [Thalassobacillus sp. CUG 92003]